MTSRFFIAMLLLLCYNISFSCDLCTIYLGIQPNDFTNSFSVRHRYRLFERNFINNSLSNHTAQRTAKGIINTKHVGDPSDNISEGETYTYSEVYNSYDVAMNFFISKKIQINGNMSFSDNYVLENDSINNNIAGIGDINLTARYQLFNSIEKADTLIKKRFIHRLSVGGGLVLPTGNYNKYSVESFETSFTTNTVIGKPKTILDPHLQAGTGAFSYLLLSEYLMKINNIGINTNASYRISSANKNEFQFANRLNVNSSIFMLNKLSKKVKIMNSIGLSYEYSKRDTYKNEPLIDSGGDALFLNIGVNLFINKVGLEFNYFEPLREYLLGIQPFNKRRIVSQLTYYF